MVVGGQVLTHWLPDSEGSLHSPLTRSRAGHIKAPSLPLLEAHVHAPGFRMGKDTFPQLLTQRDEW